MAKNFEDPNEHPHSLEGMRLLTRNDVTLGKALQYACDYRGDVTIHLTSGEQIIGYVFTRQKKGENSFIKMFLSTQSEPCTVQSQDISAVEFSGEDTAFGRSWDDWAKKWQKPQVS